MSRYLSSSPHFFRLIRRAFLLAAAGILLLALVVPAPLQGPADPGRVPNPVKSAWFLLWTQELVSYSASLVYLILGMGLLFLLLPWLPGTRESRHARWLSPEDRTSTFLALAAFLGIVALTLVAAFFRGENWTFVSPF